jgi:hypothetical protein
MGTLLFGTDETLNCIQHVEVKGPKDESLCLGYKISKVFFGAGIYLKDDGYVLRLENDAKHYFPLPPERVEKLQEASLLPRPLPAYSIPWYEYAFGYSLWIVIAVTAFFMYVGRIRRKQREAEDAATPTSAGPPNLVTAADRFVDAQAAALLEPGEAVQHQAYGMNGVPGGGLADAKLGALYVVLTSRRLILITARAGAFGPLLENRGTEVIDRRNITGFAVGDRVIDLRLADGSTRRLWISPTGKLSNQRAFLRDVPRLLGGAAPGSLPAAQPAPA